MKDEQLEDLKQFIDSRISQSEARTDESITELGKELREEIGELRNEMLDVFTRVGDAIDIINKHIDERLTKLEKQSA